MRSIYSGGYVSLKEESTEKWFYRHQLLACVESDPHEVFAEDTDVHHEVPELDLPKNVVPMSSGNHRELDHSDQAEIPIEEALDR